MAEFLTDQYESEIDRQASRYGVPENFLEAMILRESSGNWPDNNRLGDVGRRKSDGTPDYILPFVGVFESTAESYGMDFESLIGNREGQIGAMAQITREWWDDPRTGSWLDVGTVYFGGPGALSGTFHDELGMDSETYRANLLRDWQAIDRSEGVSTTDEGAGETDYDRCMRTCLADPEVPDKAKQDACEYLCRNEDKTGAASGGHGCEVWDVECIVRTVLDSLVPSQDTVLEWGGRIGIGVLGVVLVAVGVKGVLS